MRTTRHSINTSQSLRKLKTAFSPFASSTPVSSYSVLPNSTSSTPLTVASPAPSPARSASSGRLSHFSTFSSRSSFSASFRNMKNSIRRSPSTVELEQEEERLHCGDELLGLIEPRPVAATYVAGFEEVLFGRL